MQGQHELHNKKVTTAAHHELEVKEHELRVVKERELKVMGAGEEDHVQDVSKCQEPG
jgi:hypothetical protein